MPARQSKSELMLGRAGIALLARSTVMVFGLGGVGSSCTEALARAGIGSLVIVDHARVTQSNVNRQAIAFSRTLGMHKTAVMKAMIEEINPTAQVTVIDRFVVPAILSEVFDAATAGGSTPDFVVDAIDTVATKLAIARYACDNGLSLVSSMGAGNKFNPEQLEFADIYDTSVCPLCKVMRKEARKHGIDRLRVLFSREKPADVEFDQSARRSERAGIGTMSYMPPIMGQMIAGDVIRTLLHAASFQQSESISSGIL